MSLELWDMDTNTLLCRNVPTLGNSTKNEAQNELGYVVAIPPCVWGSAAENLLPPPIIRLDGNYATIKQGNNTYGHYG